MSQWYTSINIWCTLISCLVCGGILIGLSVMSYHYTEFVEGSLIWIQITSISGFSCGVTYLILGLGSVLLFILAFNIIGQCLSCLFCCCSCGGCLSFFILSIVILSCGLNENSLANLSPEAIAAIEQDFNCCAYSNNYTSCQTTSYDEEPFSLSYEGDCDDSYLHYVLKQYKTIGSVMLISSFSCLFYVATNLQGTLRMNEGKRDNYLLIH
ncbi:hypothetical protein KM1_236280 [Entamoeba histolytica HM-3:IMSS]|uniref:Tetraspanin family protein n=4 Tax=Entamoeba histolytica TaxID=5759 RepID=C4MB92_ENTH1|nr:hypothetical protein EHI_093350 [Entamoeba histolytica HM-1:IMSS]EAL50444.1 hypothetical protein EHI_093350 [Entamoeba histolytica HM-1:IMSS]EMD48995.1 Hypothetical protein EHI5A_183660 [Entamoeba histolytica KU27]EMS17412.1 hypothetical protein KM1_236280 [Entamoeba histolytica HM-3:IMSS]GAT99209.1 hypothetical protein CL6EHI_093350 [Entamoeba histolytica]|eukprot:XP_655830.1 hypothetical protein EHI_093350 [Entamoeba histolytica HM-1:IMSS]